MVLLHRLIQTASADAGRRAFVSPQGETTYGTFLQQIRRVAGALASLRCEPGDRVVLCAPNSPALAACYFGIHWLGATAVPVDPGLPEDVLTTIAATTSARLLISHRQLEGLPCVTPDQLAAGEPLPRDPACAPDSVADILFTTGTTGERKGVVLTHTAIAQAAVNITAFLGNDSNALEMVPLPLSHSFGLGRLRCMALVGNAMVIEKGMMNAAALLKRLNALGVTGFACVPSGWEMLMRLAGAQFAELARSLRYVEIGSMPMKPEVRRWLMQSLPHARLCHHYGLTEASRAAFTEYHSDAHKPNSIGRPSPNVSIAIEGDDGELVIRGGMLLREYWRNPELTARLLTPSGFHTGDLGWADADGYLYLHGRRDDVINVGGKKVAPEEVEEVLLRFDGIRDAACVGIADPEGVAGHVVKAFVVAAAPPDPERLRAHLRSHLEEYQVPRLIECVGAIPRTESGKIQRRKLLTAI